MNSSIFLRKEVQSWIKAILLFVIAVILLTLGFYRNEWKAAGKKWFYDWQRSRDFWVIGRVAWSQQNGVFSDGALLGIGDGGWPPSLEVIDHQFEVYLNGGQFDSFWTYTSAPGFQGILYSLIDQAIDFDPAFNLKLFRGFTALLTALILAALVTWFYLEFGVLAAVFALGFMMVSEWLALFSGSIYWQLWTFFLPVVSLTYYFNQDKDMIPKPPYWLIFGTVVIKGLFTGFEFISTALVSIFVPVVYYAVLNRWKLPAFLRFSIHVAGSALSGVVVSLGILFSQISSAMGSWKDAGNVILFALQKRTFFVDTPVPGELETQSVKVSTVLWKYIDQGRAINFGNIFQIDTPWLAGFSEIKYLHIIILFICISALFLIFYRMKFLNQDSNKTFALLMTTWFSILAPFSWFVFFKSHSNIHTQLNYIICQIPFILYGFAFCGATLQDLITKVISNLNFLITRKMH